MRRGEQVSCFRKLDTYYILKNYVEDFSLLILASTNSKMSYESPMIIAYTLQLFASFESNTKQKSTPTQVGVDKRG